jgi:hypothetical protein
MVHDGAAAADGLGFLDLQQRRTGVADGEEELGVFLAANGAVTPVHGCSNSLCDKHVACECERFHESLDSERDATQPKLVCPAGVWKKIRALKEASWSAVPIAS